MIKTIILFLLLLSSIYAKSQSKINVTGKVLDKTTPVPGAGVYLFYGKDTLKTVTDTAGNFYFKQVGSSNFSIKVRSLGYAVYQHQYEFPPNANIRLEPLLLKEESLQLKNVEIKGKVIPMVIKEDTLEYDARAFQVQEKDRVSEMLKLMPGLQVDYDGNVTSMGEKLVKIRVNGKDFFTGNVKEFVSKLPADIVSKVQVIDDYGDEANFTGNKTGRPKKILNIVTKENIDSGKFGSVTAQAGTNDRIGGRADANYWKGEKQMSADTKLNTQNNGVGKANSMDISASYNNKISKNTTLKTSYGYLASATDNLTLSDVETVINQGVLNNKNSTENYSNQQAHGFSGTLDSKSTKELFRLSFLGRLSKDKSNGLFQSVQSGLNRQDQNNLNATDADNPSLTLNLTHSLKFAKPGRYIQYQLESTISNNASNEYRTDQTTYYNNQTNLVAKDSILNRRIEEGKRDRFFSGSVTFGEPLKSNLELKRKKTLVAGYSFSYGAGKNHLSTFAGNPDGYVFVDSLSNAYTTSFTKQETKFSYLFSRKGLRYSFGLNSILSNLKGEYQNTNASVNHTLFTLSPMFNFFVIMNKTSVSVTLDQTSTMPTFNQLQPVPETRNLQRIVIGNPDLKPEVAQNLKIGISKSWADGTSLQGSLNGGITQNKLTTNTLIVTDTLNSLRQEIRYLNTNGDLNFKGTYMMFKTIKKVVFTVSGEVAYANNVYFSENTKGLNRAISFSQSFGCQINSNRLVLQPALAYKLSKNNYSIGTTDANTIQSWWFEAMGRFQLTQSFNLTSSLKKTINTGYNFDNPNPFLVELGMDKALFKKAITIRLSVDDLLNQGNNQQRSFSGNVTTDTRTNQVKRYFLFGITYSLDKFGKAGSFNSDQYRYSN